MMNADYRHRPTTLLAVFALLAIILAGCRAHKAYKRGLDAEMAMNYEIAAAEFKVALDRDPGNIEYQLKYNRARFNSAFEHFEAGRRALDKEDYQNAKMEFMRVLEIDRT